MMNLDHVSGSLRHDRKEGTSRADGTVQGNAEKNIDCFQLLCNIHTATRERHAAPNAELFFHPRASSAVLRASTE